MGWKEKKERFNGFRRAAWAWLKRYWWQLLFGLLSLALSLCLLYPAYLDYLAVEAKKDRVEALRNLALAGAALIGGSWGFILAIWRTRSQQQAADAAMAATKSSDQKLVSETFATAVELLGNKESMTQRQGAIHTLGRLAHQNQDLHLPIMELLTSFIREHAPWPLKEGETSPEKPRADVQEAVKVLGKRNVSFDPEGFWLDLRSCDLQSIEMRNLNFAGADLTETNLTFAKVILSDFSCVKGMNADFTEAKIRHSKFDKSTLIDCDFSGAIIDESSFRNSEMLYAHFDGSTWDSFNTHSDLRGADLTYWRGLDPRYVSRFLSDDKTIWPEGFTPPSQEEPAS